MIDMSVYTTIYQAATDILRNNVQQLGNDFCQGFLTSHDPRNGQQAQANTQKLYDYVFNACRQLNNGSTTLQGNQLFEIVGEYIKGILQIVRNQGQQRQTGFGSGGFGSSGGGFSTGFSSGGFGSGSGGFGQQRQVPMSSYTGADVIPPQDQQRQAAPVQAQQTSETIATSTVSFDIGTKPVNYAENPLDDITETGIEFIANETAPTWGSQKPKDRRIILASRENLKTSSKQHQIGRYGAYHQVIMDDPMDVVKDFFEVAPDDLLGSNFMFKITYQHLDVINVPTSDFVEIRRRCIEAVAHDAQTPIHRTVISVLENMQQRAYKAMTNYLIKHVNRALHLSARLTNDPTNYLKIGEFEDLNDLLSSSFVHPFTTAPDGRHKLEKIVGTAIWNAIVMNADAMFTSSAIPTNAMQSSPAFPFSLDGVYPSKFAIPTSSEDTAEKFLERMNSHELMHRTYVLSKRAITITNILGKAVLPKIGDKPSIISNAVAGTLLSLKIPYTSLDLTRNNKITPVEPYVPEVYPAELLQAYYDDHDTSEEDENTKFERLRPDLYPVDHTIFAIQYGKGPKEYLMALDVFDHIDMGLEKNQVILAKKDIEVIRTNA
jgi:hypothetical protein